MEIKTIARKWGNSLAIILPKSVVEEKSIREDDEIVIEVKSRPLVGEFFGKFPNWKRSTQEIKDNMRKGWD